MDSIQLDIQRLRNLTTGRLHTKMEHIYQDIESITQIPGLMTHQIHNAMCALEPYLREQVTEPRFWDGQYDLTHTGIVTIQVMSDEEQNDMLKRFSDIPSPIFG